MKCPHCGAELVPGALICLECQHYVAGISGQPEEDEQLTDHEKAMLESWQAAKRRKVKRQQIFWLRWQYRMELIFVWILALLVGSLLLVYLLLLLFPHWVLWQWITGQTEKLPSWQVY